MKSTLTRKVSAAKRFLDTSLARTTTPENAARHREAQLRRSNPLKRATALLVCKFALSRPAMAHRLVGRIIPPGMEFVGGGHWVEVYRAGDEVLKIYKGSTTMTEAERLSLIRRETERHETLRQFVGETVLPQTLGIAPHPANPKSRAVVARQQFTPFDSLDDVFCGDLRPIGVEQLDRLLRRWPHLVIPLHEFVAGGLRMFESTRMVPDVSSRLNIGITRDVMPRLVLVDGLPLTDKGDHAKVVSVLDQLTQVHRFVEPLLLDRPPSAPSPY